MTLEETSAVMDILTVAYPQFYRNQTDEEKLMAAKLWTEMFSEEDVSIVLKAVKALIATDKKGYPPHIGAVKDKILKMTTPEEMTELEAWGYVRKAISNGIYGAAEEFEKLPPIVKRLVGSSNQIREWAIMDVDTVDSVVASNFQRSFRARAEKEREFMALPADVKDMVSQLAGSKLLMLEGGEEHEKAPSHDELLPETV